MANQDVDDFSRDLARHIALASEVYPKQDQGLLIIKRQAANGAFEFDRVMKIRLYVRFFRPPVLR